MPGIAVLRSNHPLKSVIPDFRPPRLAQRVGQVFALAAWAELVLEATMNTVLKVVSADSLDLLEKLRKRLVEIEGFDFAPGHLGQAGIGEDFNADNKTPAHGKCLAA